MHTISNLFMMYVFSFQELSSLRLNGEQSAALLGSPKHDSSENRKCQVAEIVPIHQRLINTETLALTYPPCAMFGYKPPSQNYIFYQFCIIYKSFFLFLYFRCLPLFPLIVHSSVKHFSYLIIYLSLFLSFYLTLYSGLTLSLFLYFSL